MIISNHFLSPGTAASTSKSGFNIRARATVADCRALFVNRKAFSNFSELASMLASINSFCSINCCNFWICVARFSKLISLTMSMKRGSRRDADLQVFGELLEINIHFFLQARDLLLAGISDAGSSLISSLIGLCS